MCHETIFRPNLCFSSHPRSEMATPVPYDLSFQNILQPIIDLEQILQQLADVQLKISSLAAVMEDHEVQMAMTTVSDNIRQVMTFYESARWQAQLNARNLIQMYMHAYGRLPSIDIHSRHGG